MKILFLDIDGVLNCHRWWRIRTKEQRAFDEKDPLGIRGGVDPYAMSLLNNLLSDTDAQVVVSSTVRKLHSLEELRQVLKGYGFRGMIIDKTPKLDKEVKTKTGETLYYGKTRGAEIQHWLDYSGHVYGITGYAIVDDDSDMKPLMHKLVQTEYEDGLMPRHCVALKEMLTKI